MAKLKLNTEKQQIKLMKLIASVNRIASEITKKPRVSRMLKDDSYHYARYRAKLLEARVSLEKAVICLQKCEKKEQRSKQGEDQPTLFGEEMT